MSKSYAEHKIENTRLSILRVLIEDEGRQCSDALLYRIVPQFVPSCSRDMISTQLDWLERQGYLRLEQPSPDLRMAYMEPHAEDVARGRITVPGIARPSRTS